jgi:hypothetical protein
VELLGRGETATMYAAAGAFGMSLEPVIGSLVRPPRIVSLARLRRDGSMTCVFGDERTLLACCGRRTAPAGTHPGRHELRGLDSGERHAVGSDLARSRRRSWGAYPFRTHVGAAWSISRTSHPGSSSHWCAICRQRCQAMSSSSIHRRQHGDDRRRGCRYGWGAHGPPGPRASTGRDIPRPAAGLGSDAPRQRRLMYEISASYGRCFGIDGPRCVALVRAQGRMPGYMARGSWGRQRWDSAVVGRRQARRMARIVIASETGYRP